MYRSSALALCLVLPAGLALSQTLPAGVEKKASLGGVTEYDFPNGLRVLLAIAIKPNHPEEALSTARPACAAVRDGPMRKLLDDRKLCGT